MAYSKKGKWHHDKRKQCKKFNRIKKYVSARKKDIHVKVKIKGAVPEEELVEIIEILRMTLKKKAIRNKVSYNITCFREENEKS